MTLVYSTKLFVVRIYTHILMQWKKVSHGVKFHAVYMKCVALQRLCYVNFVIK